MKWLKIAALLFLAAAPLCGSESKENYKPLQGGANVHQQQIITAKKGCWCTKGNCICGLYIGVPIAGFIAFCAYMGVLVYGPKECTRITVYPHRTRDDNGGVGVYRFCGLVNETQQEVLTKETQIMCPNAAAEFVYEACMKVCYDDIYYVPKMAGCIKDPKAVDAAARAAKIAALPSTRRLQRQRHMGFEKNNTARLQARGQHNHTQGKKGKR